MYLQALKLHGFKSFADPTTLRFQPGVTAIVGPNGCGKSNIADAIRWVLGEQSAKALRGGKMQDVIFEGADTRKPAQLCEVALLLTECEKQLGSEFHEIEIMRRVHRDGQSEYYFNGQVCRLKDIHKLFMDTGIGRTSYSIMAQGQIDQVLSSKPEERRAVFEEAAGITRYKSQRREAMAKLAMTDQNLARVADVIGEVSRQIGSLRRQAAKAMRYKKVSHRLRHLSLAWNGFQYRQLADSLAELERRVGALKSESESRRGALESRQSALDERKAHRSHLNQRAQDAQQAVYDVRSQLEAADNAAKMAQVRKTGLDERVAAAREDLSELEMQMREVATQVDTGAHDKQLQLGLLGSSDAVFQQRNRELGIAEGELGRLEQALQQARFELLQLESTVARLRTDCSGYEVDQKTSANQHELLARDLEAIAAQEKAAAESAAGSDARTIKASADRDAALAAATAAQHAVQDLTREFRDAQRKLSEIDRQLAQRSARLKLLQQLHERWEGFGEGAKAVLQGRLSDSVAGSKTVPVSQGLDVKPDCGRAVEALLGASAEAISVDDGAAALRILSRLESEQIGSAVLQIPGRQAPLAAPSAPAGLTPATDAIQAADSNHPAALLLADCYIADDLGAFLASWSANPEFQFTAVATRKGELVDRRGVIHGGYFGGKKQAQGIVQREIDLRETSRALAEEQKLHDAQRAAIEAVTARLAEAEQAVEQRRAEVLATTQAVAAAQAEQRGAQRAHEEISGRRARMDSELAALAQARLAAQSRWEKARAALTGAEAAVANQKSAIESAENAIAVARVDRDTRRDSLAQARLDLAERRQKVEVLDRGLGEMEKRRLQLGDLLVERQSEIESWTSQSEGLEAETAAQKERSVRLAETLQVAKEQVEKVRAELLAVEAEIDAHESAQASLRTEADRAQGDLGAQEIRLAEARQRMGFLAEEVTRDYQVEIAGIDWKLNLWRADDEPADLHALDLDDEEGEPAEPAPRRRSKHKAPKGEPTEADLGALDATNWQAVKAEADALRQRISAMGSVNLIAIEEYGELKQRHDFLTSQCSDLTNAKAELVKAIDEINRTSMQQFEVTFEQVKKNFAYTFHTLFGGGRAELELLVTEDILESGIEIVAQPPGTKLKSISLLSGGQKTLTAVALLFALYMVKPSPFCLLDELDAPLDESNIGRFTELLKKFVQDSQFIIITHNKRTVAATDAIYGVTMEERGVSKTVSMRFNHERGEAEKHAPNLAEAAIATATAVPAV